MTMPQHHAMALAVAEAIIEQRAVSWTHTSDGRKVKH